MINFLYTPFFYGTYNREDNFIVCLRMAISHFEQGERARGGPSATSEQEVIECDDGSREVVLTLILCLIVYFGIIKRKTVCDKQFYAYI